MWLQSYMHGWCQYVKAKRGKSSDLNCITVDIPQCGPISAKIFTYGTNSISKKTICPNDEKCNISKYSDDTRILYRHDNNAISSDQNQYNKIVTTVAELSATNNLKLNETKCQEVTFQIRATKSTRQFSSILEINGKDIPKSEEVKYLGLIISSNLTWSTHINWLTRKLNITIKNFTLILPYLEYKTKIEIFNTYILSVLLYGSEVWGFSITQSDRKKLRKIISCFSKISSINKVYLIKLANEQFEKKYRKRIEKIMTNNDHPLNDKLKQSKQLRHNTRRQRKVLFCRTQTYQSTFIPQSTLLISDQKKFEFL